MFKYGLVTQRNEPAGLVTVKFERPEACGNCSGCDPNAQKGEIQLQSDCQVGDWVRVELPETLFLRATFLVYVIPLVGLLVGLGLGWLLSGHSDMWAVLGAFIGLLTFLGALYLIDKRLSAKAEWSPKITAVYAEKPSLDELHCDIS